MWQRENSAILRGSKVYNRSDSPDSGGSTILGTFLVIALGLVTVATAVYGGYITAPRPGHRLVFVLLGAAGVILTVAVGVRSARTESEASDALRQAAEDSAQAHREFAAARREANVGREQIERERAEDRRESSEERRQARDERRTAQRVTEDLLSATHANASKLDETSRKLDPFVELAKRKYPELAPNEALNRLAADLQEVKSMAQAPILSVKDAMITREDESGVTLVITFKKSNRQELAPLDFRATVIESPGAEILTFEPTETVMSYSRFDSAQVSASPSSDRRSARLQRSVVFFGEPKVLLKLSKRASIRIEGVDGNNGLVPTLVKAPAP